VTAHSFERTLWDLRARGWRVAIHNDYRQGGEDKTFWLLTHATGTYVKGEGASDMAALMECDAAIRALSAVPASPRAEGE
jgi:hypothetical protein